MKNNSLSSKFPLIVILLIALAALQACQGPATPGVVTPAATSTQGGEQAQGTAPAGKTPGTAGEWSLAQPAAGLEAHSSYHQVYASMITGTYQGQPYESSTHEDRLVSGPDEASLVNATTNNEKPYYLQVTRLGGQTYVQQKSGQACRAQDTTGRPQDNLNPALKLPPVFSGTKVGSETLNGLPSDHYHFTADAVRNQAGKNGTADGDVWVAQAGGTLVKYQLTVQVKDGDFLGTRSWSYELTGANQAAAVALPDGCLPLLSDLPALPGAAGVVSLPGFLSYTSNSTIDAAVKFFQEQLPAKNWYALPGDAPQPASARLKFGRAMADGSGQVLVIQLAAQNQGLEVVLQVVKTNRPIQSLTPAAAATPSGEEATETPESETGASLPANLPVYPGAQIMVQNDQMIMAQSSALLDQVAKFYEDQMSAAGWSKTADTSMGGMTSQSWEKGDVSLTILLILQNNQTQIMISPQ